MARSVSDQRSAGAIVTFVVAFLALAALLASVVTFIARWNQPPSEPPLPAEGCWVTVDDHTTFLDVEQSENAAIIVGESLRRGLPARAASIALVTAYQESGMRNIDYGDRDSLGLFQQRPSQGWGEPEQIMDPWYSSGKFYEALVKVPGWETGVINDVAQEVQRSAHPDEYGKHEPNGRAWASALAGFSPAAISCIDHTEAVFDASVLTSFYDRVWPEMAYEIQPTQIMAHTGSPEHAWAVAQLSMMYTNRAGILQVQSVEQAWQVSATTQAEWNPAQPAAAPVVIWGRGEPTGG